MCCSSNRRAPTWDVLICRHFSRTWANWYEDQQPGLGLMFAGDFISHYRLLVRDAQLYAVRFAEVRRLESLISRTCCDQVKFCPFVHSSRILQALLELMDAARREWSQ